MTCFFSVLNMNKKEAIAYAQIALNYLQSSSCKEKLDLENLGIEMNKAFNMYPKDVATIMADKMVEAEREFYAIR